MEDDSLCSAAIVESGHPRQCTVRLGRTPSICFGIAQSDSERVAIDLWKVDEQSITGPINPTAIYRRDDPVVSGDVKDWGKAILVDFKSGKNELHPNMRAALLREKQLKTKN